MRQVKSWFTLGLIFSAAWLQNALNLRDFDRCATI
jgi:hypothetical protein